MIDFELARTEAFLGLQQTNKVEKIVKPVKTKLGFTKNIDFWKVTVEVFLNDRVKDFELLLKLKPDFPLSIPEIYLSNEDYEATKYIPHVDDSHSICLFDQENIKIDTGRPTEVIRECLKRAVNIITDGYNKSNTPDFRDEVVAYWSNTYHTKDVVIGAYLGEGVEKLSIGKNLAYTLVKPYNDAKLFLGSESAASQKVVDFFKLCGHNVKEQEVFYLGMAEALEPPFYFNNKSLIGFITTNFGTLWPEVKSYLNQTFSDKIFIFSLQVENELLFFGFYLCVVKRQLNGWRPQTLSTFQIMSLVQPTHSVTRICFKHFSPDRLVKRTDGVVSVKKKLKLIIAGLGSIGSNLLFYLSAMDVSDFALIDPERLQLENVNRHLLTFNEVGLTKVDAVAKYLTLNNPFLNIKKYPFSIIDVIRRDLSTLNDMDIFFCAIGKDSIENYILECLYTGKITTPVVLFWVEPYLLGGHLIYINPSTGFKLKDMESDEFYQYNVIDKKNYKDIKKQLLLKEAGCQGSYIPYGKEAISRFFALVIPQLYSLINDCSSKNQAFTYIGDLDVAKSNNLTISKFITGQKSFQLLKHSI